MTDPVLIFREEALRSREAAPPPARTPQASSRWIAWAYWALLALVAAGLTAGAVVRVPEVARGPAVVRDGAVWPWCRPSSLPTCIRVCRSS